MAVVVSYGPIAGALSLAQQAGAGQGRSLQAQRDLQALQIQNEMQRTNNSFAASEMQNALAYDQLSSQAASRNQSLAQERAYQNAQLQLQQQAQQGRQQEAGIDQQLKQTQLQQQQGQFDAEQKTREENTKALNDLRAAQAQKINTPPPPKDDTSNAIRANGEALRSMDSEAALSSRQLQTLGAALAKAQDPYTGDPQQAAAIKNQIAGIKFSLDGIDPATGKKSGQGLNDKRAALRDVLKNMGKNLRPDALLIPGDGGYDISYPDEQSGMDQVDQNDPLYQVNSPAPAPQQVAGQPASNQGNGQQVTPQIILQVGQAIAGKMGLPVSDPQVRQATRQYLTQQGLTIPTIQ